MHCKHRKIYSHSHRQPKKNNATVKFKIIENTILYKENITHLQHQLLYTQMTTIIAVSTSKIQWYWMNKKKCSKLNSSQDLRRLRFCWLTECCKVLQTLPWNTLPQNTEFKDICSEAAWRNQQPLVHQQRPLQPVHHKKINNTASNLSSLNHHREKERGRER